MILAIYLTWLTLGLVPDPYLGLSVQPWHCEAPSPYAVCREGRQP